MRIRLKIPLRQALQWTERVLLAGSVLMLAYCGFVFVDAWVFQKVERRQLERLLNDRQAGRAVVSQVASHTSLPSPPPAIKGLIGRIEIPRLGLSAIVMEGIT